LDASQIARVTLGFVISPAVGLLALTLAWCGVAGGDATFAACWSGGAAFLIIGGVGALVAYPAALLFGLPLFLYCWRRGFLNLWQIEFAAFLIAVLSTLGLALWNGSTGAIQYLPLSCGVALVTGLAFWAIAVRGNALNVRGA
jgi:hypothetical protein